jgi:predicted TIM-barrel fold metal-dependent hydrolase
MNDSAAYTGTIIDSHCHVASTDFIPRDFIAGIARNVAAKLRATGVARSIDELSEAIRKQNQDHQADGFIRELDESGVSQAVLLLPDFTFTLKCDLTIAEMIERHRQICGRHPGRFFVFAGVDPRWGRDGLNLFEKTLQDPGFHGLKLYPPCGYSASDRALYPYYELCREYRAPVLLHVGPTAPTLSFNYSSPWLVDQAALDFPDVNFILAHAAVHFVEDCLTLAEYRPNIFLDISAFPAICPAPNGWKPALRKFFQHGVNHKILFGSDWPLSGTGRHRRLIQAFVSPEGPLNDISSAQRDWIMQANISRLITPKRSSQPGARNFQQSDISEEFQLPQDIRI